MVSDRYVDVMPRAEVSLAMKVCRGCGALIDGTHPQALSVHDDFHLRVETALTNAQGYNLDGTTR